MKSTSDDRQAETCGSNEPHCSASEEARKRAIREACGIQITGSPRSVDGVRHIASQFDAIARRYDSGSHEMAAIVMCWACDEIEDLRRRLKRIVLEAAE